jgi:hypothetical protein
MAWSKHEEKKNSYRIINGKPKRKILLQRPRHRWRIILKRSYRDKVGRYELD